MDMSVNNNLDRGSQEVRLLRILDPGIDDMENGRELPLEEAFREINKLRNIKRNTRKRQAITTIKNTIIPIAKSYGVKRVYMFGSYAKGTATEESDIDLLIEKGKPMSLLMLSGMRQRIQEELNISVDLVTTAGIQESFKKEIEGEQILLFDSGFDINADINPNEN